MEEKDGHFLLYRETVVFIGDKDGEMPGVQYATQQPKQSRRRPDLLRALGASEPPEEIQARGRTWQRLQIFKHDSWAATATYTDGDETIVCKFNRTAPILGLPAAWVGRCLAGRERQMYRRMADVDAVPNESGDVSLNGQKLQHAVAHEYIKGTPLRWHHRLSREFFDEFADTLLQLHDRGIAIVDLNKKENIILGTDGRPHLIDFQISLCLPKIWPFSWALKILQASDRYHFSKHLLTFRPDLLPVDSNQNPELQRPICIRLHRKFAIPARQFRRWLLVKLGIRKRDGKVFSEEFVEDGFRAVKQHDDPLIALQQYLISKQYCSSRTIENDAYIDRVFSDLFQRIPTPSDLEFLKPLRDGRSRDEIVIQILRAPALFRLADGLSDSWLIETRTRLQSLQAEPNAVAVKRAA